MSEENRVAQCGWAQGSLLRVTNPTPTGLGEGVYVVISHSCDVVGDDFEREPWVELAPCMGISELNGNLTFGKNPRRLHLCVADQLYEISLVDGVRMKRERLLDHAPFGQIASEDLRMFSIWLGSRFSRSAFATEFNRRCEPVMRKVEAQIKASGAKMSGIYLTMAMEELPAGVNYDVIMQVSMREDDFKIGDDWSVVNEATDAIAELLDSVPGISVTHAGVKSEVEIPISDLRYFQRWDYQYLSIRESNEGTLPVTE